MTTSRSGRSGMRSRISKTSPSRSTRVMRSRLLASAIRPVGEDRWSLPLDNFPRDGAAHHFEPRGNLVHEIEHGLFEHRPEPASAGSALQGELRHGFEAVLGELELHAFHVEEFLILLRDRVLRLGED